MLWHFSSKLKGKDSVLPYLFVSAMVTFNPAVACWLGLIHLLWDTYKVRLMLSYMIQLVLKSSFIKFVFISDESSRKMS
jgi:hypothetical protein